MHWHFFPQTTLNFNTFPQTMVKLYFVKEQCNNMLGTFIAAPFIMQVQFLRVGTQNFNQHETHCLA